MSPSQLSTKRLQQPRYLAIAAHSPELVCLLLVDPVTSALLRSSPIVFEDVTPDSETWLIHHRSPEVTIWKQLGNSSADTETAPWVQSCPVLSDQKLEMCSLTSLRRRVFARLV
jgi:hypothetical protein